MGKRKSGRVVVYTTKPTSTDTVQIGSTVVIKDCASGDACQYTIVPSTDQVWFKTMGYRKSDYAEITKISAADGKSTISDLSELGKRLIGKHKGEEISVPSERGWELFL